MDRQELLRSRKLFLFDMDGTIYCGDRLFPYTGQLLELLKATGRKYMYMTNNSAKSVEDYIKKLKKMGIPADPKEFITSAQATIHYLKKNCPQLALYICGTASIRKEFSKNGLLVTEDPRKAQAVVVCLDSELTYEKVSNIAKLLSLHPEMPYVATHPDKICPAEFGFIPDCGSICDMIYTCTGRKPDRIIGKPEPLMPQLGMEWMNCTPSETIVVGDRISTDILSGIHAGTATALVLTGDDDLSDYEAAPRNPDLVLNDLKEILDALR